MSSRRRLIVVSNRGPISYGREQGERVARRGAGGLVTALAPLVSHHDVTWIASAISAEDRIVAAESTREETARDGSRYRLRLIDHAPSAYDLYYNMIANPVLWFVQHGLWDLLLDGRDLGHAWEDGYVPVNEAFAAAVDEELAREPAAVLFHDYHLYLAPAMVRAKRPDTSLAHFTHIPWVGPEAWNVLPEPIVRSIPEWLLLRVDRTDPSKNVPRGLEAFRRLLERRPDLHGRVGMLALLDPSRQEIPEYVEERRRIEETAAALESAFPGALTLQIADDFHASVAAYKQFDVLLVNAVMDGLNLVAKEASLVNERDGVVVLSVNAGAFEELGDWVVPVEPLDVEATADALEDALALTEEERRARQAAIRAHVRANDLEHWI